MHFILLDLFQLSPSHPLTHPQIPPKSRNFYPPGADYSFVMNLTSRLAEGIRPLAWFGATIGGVYYCYRHQLRIVYVLSGGIAGFIIGFLVSAHVTADPGPNYHTSVYDVPAGCLMGTIVGVMVQALRNDWSDEF